MRVLRAANNRTLPVKTLRIAVARSLDSKEDMKDALKPIIDKLCAKGRVKLDGKNVVLLKKKKGESDDDADAGASSEKRGEKRKAEDDAPAAAPTKPWKNDYDWDEGPANAGDTGTRLFLGNLSFKINEDALKSAISGITHIKVSSVVCHVA